MALATSSRVSTCFILRYYGITMSGFSAAHQDHPGKRMVEVFGTPAACCGDFALTGFVLAERLVCSFGVVIVFVNCVAWPDRILCDSATS